MQSVNTTVAVRNSKVGMLVLIGLFCWDLANAAKAQGIAGPKKENELTIIFEMRGKPWGAVFEWLTDKTGMPFVSNIHPTGTFNFIAKKGQKFTIPQIIDLINDGLQSQKYLLLRRATSFTVVPADVELDPLMVPRIAPNELGRHGETEVVLTVLRLKKLAAMDTAPEVKKQLGPFGKVVPLAKMNQLILQDTVGNLERIMATIRSFEDEDGKSARPSLEVVPLAVLDSSRVAETLKALFPGSKNSAPYIESDPTRNAVLIKGTADQVADVKAAIGSLGEAPSETPSGRLRIITLDKGNGAIVAEALQRMLTEMRPETPVQIIGPGALSKPGSKR